MGIKEILAKGKNGSKILIEESMDPSLCKDLKGKIVDMSNGSKACIFGEDKNGERVPVEAENITPQLKKAAEKKTGKKVEL